MFSTTDSTSVVRQRMVIDSAGNVGIGTTSPGNKLQIGSVGSTGYSGNNVAWGDGTRAGAIYIDSTASWLYASGDQIFAPGSGEKVRITSAGNVGIGTTSPNAKLALISGQRGISVDKGGYSSTSSNLSECRTNYAFAYDTLRSGSTTGFFITNVGTNVPGMQAVNSSNNAENISIQPYGGNVGIGTTTPEELLHVDGTIKWEGVGTEGFLDGGETYVSIRSTASDIILDPGSGNVGIGTELPGARLHVESPISGNGLNADFSINGGSGYGMNNLRVEIPNYGSGIKVYSPTSSGTDNGAMSFYQQTSPVGNITINTSSTSYNTTSDYRLKENKEDISDAIGRVKELKPLRFNWIKEPGKPKVDGFYAHELAEVVPEAVTGEKDALDWEGNPKYQAIDQAKIVPLLTAALQQAIDKIEELELRIQTIENN